MTWSRVGKPSLVGGMSHPERELACAGENNRSERQP